MASLVDYNRKMTELMSILTDEIKMLRAGNFTNINQTSKLKMEKINALMQVMKSLVRTDDIQKHKGHMALRLTALKNLSAENGALLRGVFNGVKSVRERIMVLENQEAQVGVYGRQGRRLSFSEEPASSEKTF